MSNSIRLISRRQLIAIAGATGRVGSALTRLLASDPVDIVLLTRRPDAAHLPRGANIAAIDFDQPHTLLEALRGADRLFVAHGTSPQQVANEIALIDSAVAVGVRQIVKLSALGPASRLNPFAWHMQIEAHLAQQPVASTLHRLLGGLGWQRTRQLYRYARHRRCGTRGAPPRFHVGIAAGLSPDWAARLDHASNCRTPVEPARPHGYLQPSIARGTARRSVS